MTFPSVRVLAPLFIGLVLSSCGGGGSTTLPVVSPSGGGTTATTAPADTTPPTITLAGSAEMRHEQGTEFTDPGASASDDNDGAVTVTVNGAVDADTAGHYTLIYTATDAAGNTASAERLVTVSDTSAPVISLVGSPSITLEAGVAYQEPGATAVDSVDGELSVSITGTVGTAAGVYTLTYSASDSSGSSASTARVITVLEPEAEPEPEPGAGSPDDDTLVISAGVVGELWDRGINAFDAAIDYGECNNDGGAGCPSLSWAVVADAERGDVLEITHDSSGQLAGLFIAAAKGLDMSAYTNGAVEFDVRVVSGDAGITVKLDCIFPCTSGDQPLGAKGATGWESVSVAMQLLINGGLDITAVNTGIVIWASSHTNTVFRIDNVRFTGFDATAEPPSPPVVTVPYTLTPLGMGSYSDTINPASYRCVFDYGNWIYNAGVVEPGIDNCLVETSTPVGTPVPRSPQKAGPAAGKHTMTHRWWGSISFIGEMRIGDPNAAGYLTADPLMARITERGARFMGIPPGLSASSGGFGYAIPDPFSEVFDGAAIANSQHSIMDAKLLDYSDGSVTVGWFEGTSLIMEATLVYGSPYVFFDVYSGTPVLKTLRANSAERGVWHQGGDSLGIWSDVAGQRNSFLLVGDSGTTFTNVESNTVTISSPGNAFTLVWMPVASGSVSDSLRTAMEAYARNVVKQVTIAYAVDRASNTVTVSHRYFDAQGIEIETMAGLMPLAWKRIDSMTYSASVRSARGMVKFAPMIGFTYNLPSVGLLPALPVIDGTLDETRLTALVQEFVAGGASYYNTASDTYWNGKALGRLSEVLVLADQLGMTDEATTLRDWLKGELADWMSAERDETLDTVKYFVYDDNWSTLLGLEESFASHQQLNDHHFHYGYFIRAAAEVCRVDKAFCGPDQYGDMFEMLIRDYAGGRDDTKFPYLRNFDPANGFSWASGQANFARGNNNESTSEAANAYGAMVLYGLATSNDEITERGMYLHASTSATYWEYWNDIDGYRGVDAEKRNFPPGYPRITTSIIWGEGSAFSTWFSPAFAHILGIQGLPSNPLIMHVGLYADYLADYVELGLAESSNGKPSGLPDDQWTDLWWNLWSMTDANAAIADYEATASYNPEAGEAPAHTYHWIYTMRALGSLKTGTGELTADYPAAMAFETGGLTSYVVYNYSDSTQTVTFSDGVAVEAAPNAFTIEQM